MKFRHLPVTSDQDTTANFEQLQTVLPPLVTSLPAPATDGQEVYYLADATNGVVWHLRYRAASASTHKWEYIGGPWLETSVLDGEETTAKAEANSEQLVKGAPTITLPLAGDYRVSAQAMVKGGASGSNVAIYPTLSASGVKTEPERLMGQAVVAAAIQVGLSSRGTLAAGAGEVLRVGTLIEVASLKSAFFGVYLAALPIRVG